MVAPSKPLLSAKYQDGRLRLVLVGKTGSGKSASGNIILGRKAFKSQPAASSVTDTCQMEEGDDVTVVDSPGFGDRDHDKKEVQEEIAKCVALCAPGVHAFILVIAIGRYTEQDDKAVEEMVKIFGRKAFDHTVILFTHGDDLEFNDQTIEQHLEGNTVSVSKLNNLLQKCGNRYQVFNNRDLNNREQVKMLLDKVKKMVEKKVKKVKESSESLYTNEMLQEAARIIEKEMKTSGITDWIKAAMSSNVTKKILIIVAAVLAGVAVGAVAGALCPLAIAAGATVAGELVVAAGATVAGELVAAVGAAVASHAALVGGTTLLIGAGVGAGVGGAAGGVIVYKAGGGAGSPGAAALKAYKRL